MNTRTDYFNIGLYPTGPGERLFLMEQRQKALVMLVVAEMDRVPAALLSLRTEPGLIGLTNLSTTIQSSPDNYLRRHGGKATPLIEIAFDPHAHGDVLYDGEHHDWGHYYLCKTKRFLIVRLDAPIKAPPGYCWVELAALRQLLLESHLITNDLRVSASLLLRSPTTMRVDRSGHVGPDADSPLERLQFSFGAADTRGTTLAFFRTTTQTREISSWVQPLLVPGERLEIRLLFARLAGDRVFALEKRSQPGLGGQQLWFPATLRSGSVTRDVQTSAEGGRFWRYGVHIELREAASRHPTGDAAPSDVVWMTGEALSRLVATPFCTSLDLRMAWSLACAEP